MRSFANVDELCAASGERLGTSDWRTVGRATVDRFLALTRPGCRAPDVVPPELLLALIPALLSEVVEVRDRSRGINYGLDGARFPALAVAGGRVRASALLASADPLLEGAQVVYRVTIEAENLDGPVCEARTVARIFR